MACAYVKACTNPGKPRHRIVQHGRIEIKRRLKESYVPQPADLDVSSGVFQGHSP
jgi:hypothetical protein